jgi:Alr-MurF fusion protein
MNLHYSYTELASVFGTHCQGVSEGVITRVSIDTRSIVFGDETLFFALKGKRNGADFINEAYKKGCRAFVLDSDTHLNELKDACYFIVKNPLIALQGLASYHRKRFQIPVLGITGSAGKTITKEWLYHFLRDKYTVIRSPKSYNSQIGVALSVLELKENHTFALFEAGISQPNEMHALREMIQPTFGLFTGIGSAHSDGFADDYEKRKEKEILFSTCEWVVSKEILDNSIPLVNWDSIQVETDKETSLTHIKISDYGSFTFKGGASFQLNNIVNVLLVLKQLDYPACEIQYKLNTLPEVIMRMEMVTGKNENTLINDAYNMDMDGLENALAYQQQLAGSKKRIVVLGFGDRFDIDLEEVKDLVKRFKIETLYLCGSNSTEKFRSYKEVEEDLLGIQNSVILFKGTYQSGIAPLIHNLSRNNNQTFLEINKQSLRHNLTFFKSILQPNTKLMVMVKASSYGSGSKEMAAFLAGEGVDYLGVAFADEGIDLRKTGITLPILVMNAHSSSFDDVIRYELEPAIFSIDQLDSFTRALIFHNKTNYPIHIKVETGMNRLGFVETEMDQLIAYIKAQPEVRIQSVYSHLAESENSDQSFTTQQIHRFTRYANQLENELNYKIDRHICNTSGIVNYPEAHFELVRLGIGLFGIGTRPELKNVLQFKTHISKINQLKIGESLGYNREHVAAKEEQIAVLPVGYADGLRRIFGNQNAHVYINGNYAPIVGNICMDMCFIDVTGLNCFVNQEVELFGNNHSIQKWAKWADTIPYEMLTAISTRVKRIWIEE